MAARSIGRCGGLPIFTLSRLYSRQLPEPYYPEITLESSSSMSLKSPLPMFAPQPQDIDHQTYHKTLNFRFFSPTENKFVTLKNRILPETLSDARCLGFSNGWLFLASRQGECGLYAANVLSSSDSSQIMQLPLVETLDPTRLKFVHDPSSPHFSHYLFCEKGTEKWLAYNADAITHLFYSRIAMSSSPQDDDCTVRITHNMHEGLAFCRIGDCSWTCLGNQFDGRLLGDVKYSKRKRLFYVVTSHGDIQAWDLNDPSSPKNTIYRTSKIPFTPESFSRHVEKMFEPWSNYLVESPQGDMLLVVRWYVSIDKDLSLARPTVDGKVDSILHYRTAGFDVCKIDFERGTGEFLESIGDTVLFVGCNESFSVSAKDYPGLRPNSIYFDDQFCYCFMNLSHCGGHVSGVFYLEDHTVSPLYHPFKFQRIEPPPTWVLPQAEKR